MKVATLGLTVLSASALLLARAEDAPVTTDAVADAQAEAAQQLAQKVHDISKDGLFVETFESEELFDGKRWFKSTHEKYSSQEVSLDEHTVASGHVTDKGLVLDKPAKHYGLAVKLDEPLLIDGSDAKKEMVVQYEVKLKKGLTCGGAYVKLLRANESGDFSAFSDETPFVLMFGPDKCGSSDKVHLIFQHKNPITGKYEEKHLTGPPKTKSDKLSHLYTAVIRDDNTYEMFIDQVSVSSGSILESFSPDVLPPKQIADPEDKKPDDWVDAKEIDDPTATKPEDWDEDAPARIPDEDAEKPADWLDDEQTNIDDSSVVKPEDWDDEDDGDWIAPQIPNPKCESVSGCGEWTRPTKANPAFKGKWKAPRIPNPEYKGPWAPRLIDNPEYFEDEHPARLDPIGALAVEVWTMSEGIVFDNFWLGNDLTKAQAFANATFVPKHEREEAEKKTKDSKDTQDSESSLWATAESYMASAVKYGNANPVIALGGIVVVSVLSTLAVFFLCCASSRAAPIEKEHDSEPEETTSDSEKKGAESDDSSKKLRQRKKAPIVKDD